MLAQDVDPGGLAQVPKLRTWIRDVLEADDRGMQCILSMYMLLDRMSGGNETGDESYNKNGGSLRLPAIIIEGGALRFQARSASSSGG